MRKNKIPKNNSPLSKWLLDYADEQDVNLTALSLKAGLSAGSLRSLVNFPNRKPSLETCIRLSEITGKPIDEVLALADLGVNQVGENVHPDKSKLIQIYDQLPVIFRRSLMKVAETLSESIPQDDQTNEAAQ